LRQTITKLAQALQQGDKVVSTTHGDKVPGGADTSGELWRGLMMDYLARPLPDGRPLLLILDGIDEAADWEPGPDLFPLAPPQGLRIVLSARYRPGDVDATSWLCSLGWERPGLTETLDLSPLSAAGVADVLQHMGFPLDRLGARVDIVAELHRLSAGDPLLVRLYVDDLWSRGEAATRLRPEDLRAIPPGLEGYFARWWEDQRRLWGQERSPLREPAVQTLLALLSCALGPLGRDDIIHLSPSEARLNTFTLEEALIPLKRFVIGDGRQLGYVFSHPRLGTYFYEQLTEQERQDWESRWLAWGQETLIALQARQLVPEKASPYIVQYYGAHLERARCGPEALLALVNDGWRQAWERQEGAYAGFLNDVDRAWRVAERANQLALEAGQLAPYLGDEIRCALCHASINSLAGNIPPALLVALVEKAIWSPVKGLTYARQVPSAEQKAIALTGLAPHLPESLLPQALAAIQTIEDAQAQIMALTGLTPYLPDLRKEEALQQALEAVQTTGDVQTQARAAVLTGLLPHLAESRQAETLQQALVAAETIEDVAAQARALARLLPYLPEPRRAEVLQQALAVAQTIKNGQARATALAELAPHLPEGRRAETLQQALGVVQTIGDAQARADVLIDLAPYLPETLLPQALAAAQTRGYRWMGGQARALAQLAPYLPEVLLQQALGGVHGMKDPVEQARALAQLAPYLPEVLLRQALATTQTLEHVWDQATALVRLAPYLPEALLQQALATAQTIEEAEGRTLVLAELAPHLPETLKAEVLQQALATAQTIEEAVSRVRALTRLLPHLPETLKAEVFQQALAAAQTIEETRARAVTLAALTPYLPESLLQQEATMFIEYTWLLVMWLTGLASYLPEALLQSILAAAQLMKSTLVRASALARQLASPEAQLQQVFAAVQTIKEARARTEALPELSSHPSEGCRVEDLQQVSGVTQMTEHAGDRSAVLAALASHLPAALSLEPLLPSAEESEHTEGTRANQPFTPHLPEAGRAEALEQTLAAVQETDNAWSRARTLARLVPYLPETHRAEALEQALAAVQAIEDIRARVAALTALVPYLPEAGRAEALEQALVAVQAIEDVQVRGVILTELLPYFPEVLQQQAFGAAQSSEMPWDRAASRARRTLYRPESLLQQAFEGVKRIENIADWTTVLLREPAPYLPELLLQQGLEWVKRIEGAEDWVRVLTRLVPHLSTLLEEPVKELIAEHGEQISDRQAEVRALTSDSEPLLSLALQAAENIGMAEEMSLRFLVIVFFALPFALPQSRLYQLWRETLHALAARSRSDLLSGLHALSFIVGKLGEGQAATEVAYAIQDVGQWWP
jgi:hypothetical protein